MNQRTVRNNLAILVVLVAALFTSAACGSSADAGSSEFEDEFSESTTSDSETESSGDTAVADKDLADTDDEVAASKEAAESGSDSSSDDDAAAPAANSTALLSKSNARALWVWSETPSVEQIIENTAGAQDELLEFAKAPHGESSRAINRFLFQARGHSNADRFSKLREVTYDPLLDESKQADLRAFIKRSKAAGVGVEYLDGQAIWVASDANAEAAKQICRDVVAFNKTTNDPSERFDGVHMDIEPHTVREGPFAGLWWENRAEGGYNAEWTERWKGILNSCRSTLDAYAAETGHQMTLASDLGTDYAYYNKPILNFLNRADGPLDYVTIMNYFDNRANAEGDPAYFYGNADEGGPITGGVIENLAEWDQIPVMFAVETGPESIAQDWQSFWQEGNKAMTGTIDTLMSDYNADNMIGVGIHHYGPQSYRALKQ